MDEKISIAKTIPLKERRDEILLLAKHFIKLADAELKTGYKELSRGVEEYLLSYGWPGNEGELENVIKKACILSEGGTLEIEDLDIRHRQIKSIGKFIEDRLKGFMQKINRLERFNLYETVIPEVEKALISMVLRETSGNQVRAARLLGINRNTLRKKIQNLKIKIKIMEKKFKNP